jgi:hypothetical protein
VDHFVERHEVGEIVYEIEHGKDFVVAEGGNRVGKSVAVAAAAALLSLTRTVLWYDCTEESTAESALKQLYGVEHNTLVDRLSASFVNYYKAGPRADLKTLVLLSRERTVPEPVLVVEGAEELAVGELEELFKFAKELVDAKRGRFIFVFSPSKKLGEMSEVSALSRARVVSAVLDFSLYETMQFLSGLNCTPERAEVVHVTSSAGTCPTCWSMSCQSTAMAPSTLTASPATSLASSAPCSARWTLNSTATLGRVPAARHAPW